MVSRRTCDTLQAVRVNNTVLVIGLAIAFIFSVISLVLLLLMFDQRYYRFTNLVLFVPGFTFVIMPIGWYYLSKARDENTEVQWMTLHLIFIFGILQLICYGFGRYYVNKLYKADYKQMLLEDISDDESDSENYDVVDEMKKDSDSQRNSTNPFVSSDKERNTDS